MFIARIIGGLASYRRRHKTDLYLASLADWQLRDIGVSRHDLFDLKRSH